MDEMEFCFTKWSIFSPFCNFYSVFMISIIPDCKNNIKYDFAVLESYFIYDSLCEISDEVEFYFTKWSMFFPFCNFYSVFMIYIISE